VKFKLFKAVVLIVLRMHLLFP